MLRYKVGYGCNIARSHHRFALLLQVTHTHTHKHTHTHAPLSITQAESLYNNSLSYGFGVTGQMQGEN